MLLSMADYGEKRKITAINGKDDTRRHLESMGFVEGAEVTVVASLNGNLIVCVKDTRVALSRAVANKIIV
uniref:FeoA family protein n=1 Tax=Eubacterium sp. TaxID=142586 RepID=UPI004025F8B1